MVGEYNFSIMTSGCKMIADQSRPVCSFTYDLARAVLLSEIHSFLLLALHNNGFLLRSASVAYSGMCGQNLT